MKKLVLIIMLAVLMPAASFAGKPESLRSKILATAEEFRMCDGFDAINIGGVGTSLLKSLVKISAISEYDDPETSKALTLLNGVKNVYVADYEECAEDVKRNFNRKIERLVADYEPLFEIKEDGDVAYMYGTMNEKSSEITDLVIYTPSDCALVCISGSISIEKAMELANSD